MGAEEKKGRLREALRRMRQEDATQVRREAARQLGLLTVRRYRLVRERTERRDRHALASVRAFLRRS